jgi:hypothetical protein
MSSDRRLDELQRIVAMHLPESQLERLESVAVRAGRSVSQQLCVILDCYFRALDLPLGTPLQPSFHDRAVVDLYRVPPTIPAAPGSRPRSGA